MIARRAQALPTGARVVVHAVELQIDGRTVVADRIGTLCEPVDRHAGYVLVHLDGLGMQELDATMIRRATLFENMRAWLRPRA